MNEICLDCPNAKIGCWDDWGVCPLLQQHLELKAYDESNLGVEELEN